MERSGNFYKAIQLGYILISILIGCMAYNSLYEWQEIEALELGNKKIDELRKEINNINIQMIKFSLLGETILEWNDKDIEHYHARRMAMDSMLCRFKATYPAERIDSVRSLLEDKERQMFQIVRLMDEQQSINKKIANQIPVIVQKSVQEQSKKPKRKGFLGIFGKKEGTKPTTTTTTLRSSNRNMVNEQKAQSRRLSEQADSLAARNAELNRQLQGLICQIEKKVQSDLQNRESEITAMRKKSFMQIGGLMGFVLLLLVISYIIIHRDAKNIKRYKRKTTDLIEQLEQSVQQNEVLITSRKKAVHTITHELRTPLTAITGYTELLRKECNSGNNGQYIRINTKQEENMNKQFIITNFAAFALMLFLPTGCRQADGKQDAVQSYRVIKVAASPVEISESYSAAIRGRQDVDILPQISGRIIRLKVKEGERVKTGQVLAVIDQVSYRAALRTAQANVSAAQAKVETARIELRGKQALFDEKVISDYELSLARNQLAVACAELEQAKAQESDARNNLSYTEIKSPSNGVVGTLPYRIGALVGPNMAQPFTVVSDNAEMYAYFSISENMLRRYLARYGSIDSMIAGMPEVGLQLNDGSLYKAKGRIETVSGVVDPVTGTVQIKALFPNPDRELLSGSIGNVILQNPKTEAVTIPMTATVELQDKIIAYRLKNGQAEAAYLTVDRLNDGNRFIVKEGLSVGDTIVAEGVGLVREGMSITPKNETK